ncbi:MAG: helix-turn-helix transcriptional regulator [Desulfofustis sp. PB-SRB1]|nr:helix-turn-helix transcriptional regulator [Desulfofustis sp. PB-SRB1]
MQLFVPYYLNAAKHKISPWYILCKKYGEAIMGFPERLKRLRQEKKLDFAELAERIGIHSTQLRRYEKGESQPTLEVLRKLAVVLNVPEMSCYLMMMSESHRKNWQFSLKPLPTSLRKNKKRSKKYSKD